MVVVKSTRAGLGDLVRGVLQGILYARITGRTLVVDWKDSLYAPADVNLFPLLFDLKSLPHGSEPGRCDTVRPAIWCGRLDRSIDQMLEIHGREWELNACLEEFSAGLERVDCPEQAVVLFDYRNFGALRTHFRNEHAYLAAYTNRQILAILARQHLGLNRELREISDAWRHGNLTGFTVGVHVRRTRESGRKSTDITRLHAALRHVLRTCPVDRIFLCTDNMDVEEMLSKTYRNVVTRKKWLPEAGQPAHLTVERSDTGIKSAQDAVIDMDLLSRCDMMLYSGNSNFGLVSSYWSASNRNIDLAPPPSIMKHMLRKIHRFARSAARFKEKADISP